MSKPKLNIVHNAPAPRHSLKDWQYFFGLWFSAQTEKVSKAQQIDAATRLYNEHRQEGTEPGTITYQQVRTLKRRSDWREFVACLEKGGLEAAKMLLINDMPRYMRMHLWAANEAMKKKDYRAIAPFTVPVIDRVLPKKENANLAFQQNIHLVLSPKQVALLDNERPPIEIEVVPDDTPE